MLKLISESDAYYGVGLGLQRRFFKMKSGPYAGRIVALHPTSQSSLALSHSDPPYRQWSSMAGVINNSADYPCAGWMDDDGHIYLVYTVENSLDLTICKILFLNGLWQVEYNNIIYNLDSNYYPGVFKDYLGRLWVSWTRYSGGQYYINVKVSGNDGQNWGAGPDDPGEELVSGASSAYSRLEFLGRYIYNIYCYGGKLAYRRFDMNGMLWSAETVIFDGTDTGNRFCSAVSEDQKIGLAYISDSDLYYKEFDGTAWSGNYELDNDVSYAPVVRFNGRIPFVFYGRETGTEQVELFYSYKDGADFSTSQRLTSAFSAFASVLCYKPSAPAMYYDRTAEAADDTPGDIYHIEGGKMIADDGDAVLFGQDRPFYQIRVDLSTVGSGGAVSWYYWNGSQWHELVPSSGAYNFDSSPAIPVSGSGRKYHHPLQPLRSEARLPPLMKSTIFQFCRRDDAIYEYYHNQKAPGRSAQDIADDRGF